MTRTRSGAARSRRTARSGSVDGRRARLPAGRTRSGLDREGGRAESGLGAGRHFVELDGEPAAFGPTQVHAEQHVGPVLRVGAAGARVDRADRVTVVVVAGE